MPKIKYRFSANEANKFNKYGVDLVVYGENVPEANVVHVSVKKGHLEEFYDTKSYYIYYVVEGQGVFVLNDEKVKVQPTDLIVIPPKTRIHYFGNMDMVLTVSPAFDGKNERHARMIGEKESLYYKTQVSNVRKSSQ